MSFLHLQRRNRLQRVERLSEGTGGLQNLTSVRTQINSDVSYDIVVLSMSCKPLVRP